LEGEKSATPNPREAEIAVSIENSRKFNPSGLSAKEWIEQSDLTQDQIAKQFGGYSYSLVSTLCQKLGVMRKPQGRNDPHPNTENGRWFRGPNRFQRRQEVIADCPRLAREGNELGKLGLELFGIKITQETPQ